MTDRELLNSIEDQIKEHKLVNPIGPTPLEIIPPCGNHSPPKGGFDGWVWPIPCWDGEEPRESDGFKRHKTAEHRQHLGSDLAYRNAAKHKRDLPEWAPWYHLMSNTVPMLAMGAGYIWFAGKTSMGWSVQIDHGVFAGFPLITYYTHMSELFIPEHVKGPHGTKVYPGMELGFVGNSPRGEDLNHAHIEFWDYSVDAGGDRENRCLDPAPYLRCFGQVVLP